MPLEKQSMAVVLRLSSSLSKAYQSRDPWVSNERQERMSPFETRASCSGVESRMRIAEVGRFSWEVATVSEGRSSGSEIINFADEARMVWASSEGVYEGLVPV